MTTTERLIRNACSARVQEISIEERAELQRVIAEVPFSLLEKKTQALIIEYAQLSAREREIEAAIRKLGFETYNMTRNKPLRRTRHNEELSEVRARTARRKDAVERVRTRAAIDTLGLKPEQARKALQALQRELARI